MAVGRERLGESGEADAMRARHGAYYRQLATEARQGYPDRAILNATEAQLKGAPDFHYAPNPVVDSETLPAGGGETKKTTP